MNKLFMFFKNCFEGKERLWKAFWLLGVGGRIVFFLLALILSETIGLIGVSIGIVLYASFKVYWGYSAWKCSQAVGDKLWMYLARIYIVLAVFFGIAGITSHDWRVLKDPHTLFDRDLKVFL